MALTGPAEAAGKGDQMTQTTRISFVLLLVVALVVAGAVTIGFAQTLTMLGLLGTLTIFYLMIHISRS